MSGEGEDCFDYVNAKDGINQLPRPQLDTETLP